MSTLQPNIVLYHIKIFTSVPYKTLFSHVKKTSLNLDKSLSIITSYICICVVIKAIILGHDLLICQLQSQPSRVCLLMSYSSTWSPLVQMQSPIQSLLLFSVRSHSRWTVTMFCLFSAISRDVGLLPLPVTGSAATERETGNRCKSIIILDGAICPNAKLILHIFLSHQEVGPEASHLDYHQGH